MNVEIKSASIQQEGIWLHAHSGSFEYWNFASTRRYKGSMDMQCLKSAFSEVIKRHSVLRTRLKMEKTALLQFVYADVEVDTVCDFFDKATLCEDDFIRICRAEIENTLAYCFKPEIEFPYKFKIFSGPGDIYCSLVISHILADNMSVDIFWNDLASYYTQLITQTPSNLPACIQYADYAVSQRQRFAENMLEKERTYWSNLVSERLPVLELPFYDRHSPYTYAVKDIELQPAAVKNLKSLALKNRVLFSVVFQLAYYLLLRRYSGQETIAMGNIFHGRGTGKEKNTTTLGLFANRLLNVMTLKGDKSIETLLKELGEQVTKGYLNAEVPYEVVYRDYQKKFKDTSPLLLQAEFNLMKNGAKENEFPEMQSGAIPEDLHFFTNDTQYDIYLFVIDNVETVTLRMALRCNPGMTDIITLVMENYVELLETCISTPDKEIDSLEMCSSADRELISSFNNTAKVITGPQTVQQLFQQKALVLGPKTAIQYNGLSISYAALNTETTALAAELTRQGVAMGMVVGVLMKRTPALITTLLALLKAGAAYLPLDPTFPVQRLRFICENAGLTMVVSEPGIVCSLPDEIKIITLAQTNEVLQETGCLLPEGGANDLIYVIYTSGSTGNPKGVLIEQLAAVNLIESLDSIVSFKDKNVLCLTTVSFDIFFAESILPLCCGATVILADEAVQGDPGLLEQLIISAGVDVLQVTPTRMKMMLNGSQQCLAGLSHLLIGGEPMPADFPARIGDHFTGMLYNIYGPTETTVWSTIKKIDFKSSRISIGQPISNTGIYFLDPNNHLCGVGIKGELAISGSGLARGYIHQPQLTERKFITIPEAGGILVYKTGDIGRWLPDGDIELSGRIDNQLKLGGIRTEPEEIESVIKKYPQVKDAIVVQQKNELNSLVAFYCSETPVSVPALNNYISQFLPAYMIPVRYVHKKQLPMTLNGKIDRIVLQNEALLAAENLTASPETVTDVDNRLLTIWTQALQLTDHLPADYLTADFFDHGGHSLKALYLLEEVEKQFEKQITMRSFYKNPTLSFLQKQVHTVTEKSL